MKDYNKYNKELLDYKVSLLRDLYIQHEKPSTITAKKKAILKQMEEFFEQVKGDILFSDRLTFLDRVKSIVLTPTEMVFIHVAEKQGYKILYRKFGDKYIPCFKYLEQVMQNSVLSHPYQILGKKTKFVCPKD